MSVTETSRHGASQRTLLGVARSWPSAIALFLALGACLLPLGAQEPEPEKETPPPAPSSAGTSSKPWVKEYKKSTDWIAAGSRFVSRKNTFDVKSIDKIKLIADMGMGVEGESMILGAGIPLKEGMVKEISELGIRDEGGSVPACFEKRTLYPDGSLQWVWADFQGKLGKEYAVTIREADAAKLPEPGIQVRVEGESIVVHNGVLELKWNKYHAVPTAVSVVSGMEKIEIGHGDGKGVYFLDARGKRRHLGGKGSELDFQVESQNKLRAVLRLEGWYVTDDGAKSGRALIRYDIKWNQPWIQISHRFIVTDENSQTAYKEIGILFPSSGKK
ncbi:MAG: hypothetical protein M5U26_20255 [Planctomycetota bacterium]|nr:hypothetical protein [Planctomycetota bacterium]